jgi:hypothetical protein
MEPEPLVYREELTSMLFAIADINANIAKIPQLLEGTQMAKKGYKKTTPEYWARWRERQNRFEELLQRRLEREGITKEDALRRIRPAE